MAVDDDDAGIDVNEKLCFNGIDADTGGYLFEASSAELAEMATGKKLQTEDLAELKERNEQKGDAHYGVKEGVDATKLEEAGWGVIFPATRPGSDEERAQAAIYEALSPLFALRKAQATKLDERRYKEFRGADGYRPGESKQKFFARQGAAPGPADPDKVPYYLLIVGSPQEIPYSVPFQMDVQYAVGRIHFDTVEEYANYARSVVAAETGGLALAREVAFVGVANPDDAATQRSRKNLVDPLAKMAEGWSDVPGWKVSRYFDGDSNKAKVSPLFSGPRTPALIFSASHGMGFRKGDPRQERHGGALLLQDWGGPRQPGAIGEDLYLSADDISSDANVLGLISFNFACYGAGTPEFDEFYKQAGKERKAIADRPFVAGLPRRLLGLPKGGALATIGHVERAWGYSFMWASGKKGAQEAQLAVFESTLKSLMKGMPVGMALDYFNERYAEMASDLSAEIEAMEYEQAPDPFTLANMWTSSNDARGYAVIGDPAVRLPLAGEGRVGNGRTRESIDVSTFGRSGAASPAVAPAAAPEAPAPAGTETSFALFGAGEKEGEAKQGVFHGFLTRLAQVLEDTVTLDVRTFVTGNVGATLRANTQARDGTLSDLRAYTRVRINGSMDNYVPERNGEVDDAVWKVHREMVKQAQEARAETLKVVLETVSGLVKL